MESLLNFLNSIRPLSPQLREVLIEMVKVKEIEQGDYVLKEGNVCNKICFIEKGLFRCFHEADKKEVITWFMKQGDVFISVRSFFRQVPACENIVALEDSVIWYVGFKEYVYLKENFPEFDSIRGDLLEFYYQLADLRQYITISRTTKRRCELFFKEFAGLAKIVPDKYAAAYLGMGASTFCRSKNKFFREHTKLER